jgi:hypothetical protein
MVRAAAARRMGRFAFVCASICLVTGLACRRGDQRRLAAPPVAADTGAAAGIGSAIALGSTCFSFLDLEIPKTASRQIERSIQRCAAAVPAQRGLAAVHLRIRIEANGRVRDVRPSDAKREPIAGALLGCIETAAREWTVPHDKNQCIEVGPTFGLLPADLVVPGYHHKDDLLADFKTSQWWALCQEGEGLAPRRVRLSARTVRDDTCFGGDGRMVEVRGCARPLFVARGLPMPTKQPLLLASLVGQNDAGAAGPWPVQPWPEQVWPLLPDFEAGVVGQAATFAGHAWRLEIVNGGERGAAFLVAGGKRQWLFDLGGDSVDVRWAGDLDGDGKLDLLIQDGDEGPEFFLFLSSAAREGEVVHAVARGFNSTC